jgi:hypothetical protein
LARLVSKPGAKAGGRLADPRQEKGQLRTVISRPNNIGGICGHPIYCVGGFPVERFIAQTAVHRRDNC